MVEECKESQSYPGLLSKVGASAMGRAGGLHGHCAAALLR